jgi:threonine dehydrogenase-like Zn-dependent dehydrogenase
MIVPHGPPDDRFVYLSDVLPTAWQAVEYAFIPDGGSVAVLGLGPIGDMAARIALHRGHRVFGVDNVPERLARASARGVEVIDFGDHEVGDALRELTDGRGPDSVIDAVGMEAHGAPGGKLAQQVAGLLPKAVSRPLMNRAGTDRMAAIYTAIDSVRRGGTISLSGVYGGEADPLPMLTMFDKQIRLTMGQANVRRWSDEIMPLLAGDDDPLGVDDFATHRVPLSEAPSAYKQFQDKSDGTVKVLFHP